MAKESLIVDLEPYIAERRRGLAAALGVGEDEIEVRATASVEGSTPVLRIEVRGRGMPSPELWRRMTESTFDDARKLRDAQGRLQAARRELRDERIARFESVHWSGSKSCTVSLAAVVALVAMAAWNAVPLVRSGASSGPPHMLVLTVLAFSLGTFLAILNLVRGVRAHRARMHDAVRAAVTATIAADGPSYGLELAKKIKLEVHFMHPILREMEAEGTLVSEERGGFEGRGGRPRRYYRLAGAGLTEGGQ